MLLFLTSVALAASPTLLPGTPLRAAEPGTVELWVPDLTEDGRIKATAKGASIGSPSRLADGRVSVPLTPRQAGELSLQLRIHTSAGREDATIAVPVSPALAGGLRVQPQALVVWQDSPRRVSLQVAGSPDLPNSHESHRLLTMTSVGSLRDLSTVQEVSGASQEGDDSGELGWTLTLQLPSHQTEPAYAIVSAADSIAPATITGWAALPISAPATVRAKVDPQAACSLTTVSDTAPPVTVQGTADAMGQLELTLDLHPAVARGDLFCETPSRSIHRAVSLPAGKHPWIGWLPSQTSVPTDAQVPIQLAVVDDIGTPRRAGSLPVVTASAGQITELSLVGPGLAQGLWQTPSQPGAVQLQASLLGQVVTTSFQVVADPPGARTRAAPASEHTPAALIVWAEQATLPAGTRGPQDVHIAAVDQLGLPVSGVELDITAAPQTAVSLRTDRLGVATVRPQLVDDGITIVTASAAGLTGSAAILVGVAEGPLSSLPTSGTDRDRALRARVFQRQAADPAQDPARPMLPHPRLADEQTAVQAAVQATDEERAAVVRARPEPVVLDEPWARFALSAATVPHSYRLTSTGLQGIPAQIDADQGDLFRGKVAGAPAVHARAVVMPRSQPLGLDARLQGRYEGYVVNETAFTRVDLQAVAGARVPVASSDRVAPYLLVQAEYYRVPVFTFDSFRTDNPDKATGARLLTAGVLGARLGGGLRWTLSDALGLEAEATETLSPWPVHTRAEVGVEYRMSPLMGLRAELELGFRSMRFDLDLDQAHVTDQQHALSMGLFFLLR